MLQKLTISSTQENKEAIQETVINWAGGMAVTGVAVAALPACGLFAATALGVATGSIVSAGMKSLFSYPVHQLTTGIFLGELQQSIVEMGVVGAGFCLFGGMSVARQFVVGSGFMTLAEGYFAEQVLGTLAFQCGTSIISKGEFPQISDVGFALLTGMMGGSFSQIPQNKAVAIIGADFLRNLAEQVYFSDGNFTNSAGLIRILGNAGLNAFSQGVGRFTNRLPAEKIHKNLFLTHAVTPEGFHLPLPETQMTTSLMVATKDIEGSVCAVPRLKLCPPDGDYDGLWRRYRYALDSPIPGKPAQSLMEAVHFRPEDYDEIVLINPDIYLGNNLVTTFSQIDYLRATYPQLRIRVVSPHTLRLAQTAAFETVRLKPSMERLQSLRYDSEKVRAIPGILDDLISQSVDPISDRSFVIVHAVGCHALTTETAYQLEYRKEYEDRLDEIARQASEKLSLASLAKAKGGVVINAQKTYMKKSDGSVQKLHHDDLQFLSHWIAGPTANTYSAEAVQARIIYGDKAYLSWHRDLLAVDSSLEAFTLFKKDAFHVPEKKLVLVNFNTAGQYKAGPISERYVSYMKEIITRFRAEHPTCNLLFTAPDDHFGPNIKNEAERLVEEHKGYVGLLPAHDKSLWDQALLKADAVVTQDSGFLHMANILNDHVLAVSLSPDGQAQSWKYPDRSHALYWIRNGATPDMVVNRRFFDEVSVWLSRTLA